MEFSTISGHFLRENPPARDCRERQQLPIQERDIYPLGFRLALLGEVEHSEYLTKRFVLLGHHALRRTDLSSGLITLAALNLLQVVRDGTSFQTQ